MKETKRRFEILLFYDSTGIKKHLEKMAEQGWLLEKMSNFGWVYRKIEPKKLQFSVSYYPKASEFDPEPSEEQQIFHDFCEYSGWKLVTTWAQLQIFYNEQENPIPIDTDPVLEVESLHKAIKKNFIPSYVVLTILSMMQMGLIYQRFSQDFVESLSNMNTIFSGSVWILLGIMCGIELLHYFKWYRKAKRIASEERRFLPTKGCYVMQMFVLIWSIGGLLLWLLSLMGKQEFIIGFGSLIMMGLLILLVNGIKILLKKMKVRKEVNRTVTLGASFVLSFVFVGVFSMLILRGTISGTFEKISHPNLVSYEYEGRTYAIKEDKVPLLVSDLIDIEYDSYSTEWKENISPFLTEYIAIVRAKRGDYEIPNLQYTIYKVHISALYEKCFEELCKKYEYRNGEHREKEFWYYCKEINADIWNMDKAYERYIGDTSMNEYLLGWDNYIVELDAEWDLTEEERKIVGEKLQQFFKEGV